MEQENKVQIFYQSLLLFQSYLHMFRKAKWEFIRVSSVVSLMIFVSLHPPPAINLFPNNKIRAKLIRTNSKSKFKLEKIEKQIGKSSSLLQPF